MVPKKKAAGRANVRAASKLTYLCQHSTALPSNWRARLPSPASYYARRIAVLGKPNPSGWAQGRCSFHDDHNASLSVQVNGSRGAYYCFSCGAKGDLIAFHQRFTGLPFREAVRELLEVRP